MPNEPDELLPRKLERADWIAILGFIFVAAILRLYRLGDQSLWFDELWTWKVANQPDLHTLVTTGLQEDIHLPSYFVIVFAFMKQFGDGEAAIRMPSVIFGVLSVPALYLLGRRVMNRTVGIIAATLLLFNYDSIYYSQEARPYAMMLFLGIVSTYLWYELLRASVLQSRKPSPWLVSGLWITLAVSCYTHYFSVLLTLLQFAFYFGVAIKYHRKPWLGVGMLAALAVIAVPWVSELQLQMKNLFNWIPVQSFVQTLYSHIDLTYTWNPTISEETGRVIVSAALVALMLLFLYRKGNSWLESESSYEYKLSWVLLLAWVLPWLITEAISVTIKPIYWPRYLIYCQPFAYLLFAMQVNRFRSSRALKVGAVFVYSALYVMMNWQSLLEPQRDDWKGVQMAMARNTPKDGETALLAVTERPGVVQYYQKRFSPEITNIAEVTSTEQIPAALEKILAARPKYVWFFAGQQKGHEAVIYAARDALRPYVAGASPPIHTMNVGAYLIELRQ